MNAAEEASKLESRELEIVGPQLDRVVRDGKEYVLDPVRNTFVRLTPEERVRQIALAYLIQVLHVPPGLIAVEKALTYNRMRRRFDIVAFDRAARPLLIVECKSPSVRIDQAVLDQVGMYNSEVGAPYVLITNGVQHYAYHIDFRGRSYRFLTRLPRFDELQKTHTTTAR